ncbi:MAG: hypothetical protein KY393_08270 [Actinobacteria bacterium]|nr:hypothetical protein [Actinomycetota bacterium]
MEDDFESLFLAEYPRVLSIAQRILRNHGEAERVAGEVMVAFRREHSINPNDSAVRLHRAAVETALRRSRSRGGQGKLRKGSGPGGVEESQAVREALARMPAAGAAVLALRASRLTYAETAAVLGVEVQQVGSLLRRAELRLLKEVNA